MFPVNSDFTEFTMEFNESNFLRLLDEAPWAINWQAVCKCVNIPEQILKDNHQYIDWVTVSEYQALSENFIRDYAHLIHWDIIQHNPRTYVSDELITELQMKGII